SGGEVRITDVHLHAPQGLSSGHIPTDDFDLLLQAVTGTVPAPRDQAVADTTALPTSQPGPPALQAATASTEQPAASASKRRPRKSAPRSAAAPVSRAARGRTATAASDDEPAASRRSTRTSTTATTRKPTPTPATS